MAFLVVS